MGLLRFILAVAVLSEHSGALSGAKMMSASMAVVTFYIISGFYMSLILNQKYIQKNSYGLFISNRFLRIFPAYWVVLLLTVALCAINWNVNRDALQMMAYIKYFSVMPVGTFLFLVLSNLLIFGQDVISFLGLQPGQGLVYSVADDKIAASWFLFIPQAWTVAIELMFYLIAPFILRRKPVFIFLLMTISFGLRIAMFQLGYNDNSWTKTFFPLEFGFFLAGALTYHLYNFVKKAHLNKVLLKFVAVVFILITVLYPYVVTNNTNFSYIYYLIAAIAIPFIFLLSSKNSVDRYIGELSYPVYIVHFFTLDIFFLTGLPERTSGIVNLLLSIFFSILIIEIVIKPIDRYRQRRVKRQSQQQVAAT